VRQGRQAVYDARTRRRSVVRFLVTDYWRLIVARRKALLVAFVLLFGSAALAALWGVHDPAAAKRIWPRSDSPLSNVNVPAVTKPLLSGKKTRAFLRRTICEDVEDGESV